MKNGFATFLVFLFFGAVSSDSVMAKSNSNSLDEPMMVTTDSCEDVRLVYANKYLRIEGCEGRTNQHCKFCDYEMLKKPCHTGEVILHPDKTIEIVGCPNSIEHYGLCQLEDGVMGIRFDVKCDQSDGSCSPFPSIFVKPDEKGNYSVPPTVVPGGGLLVNEDPPTLYYKYNGERWKFTLKNLLIPTAALRSGQKIPKGMPLLENKSPEKNGRRFYSFQNIQQQKDNLLYERCPILGR